ncbi:hypothetical protein CRG98_009240 [Punica granatum]|nr:hypothetical protein CRG98_009240 [Punica granatum]
MSILAVLAFISCAIGRAYSRRVDDPTRAPPDSTNWRSVFGWMKERFHELAYGGAQFGSRLKAASFKKRGGGGGGAPGGNDNPPQP